MVVQEWNIARLRGLRSRQTTDRLDYLRGLRALAATMSQVELAKGIGISQPSVSSALQSAEKVEDVRPGFSGATPYEIAQRFSAGEIKREQVIDELSRWEYRPKPPVDPIDWLTTSEEGTFVEVEDARAHGLLDGGTYDAVIMRMRELRR